MTCALTYDRVVSWDTELTALTMRIAGPLFTRPESRQACTDLVHQLDASPSHTKITKHLSWVDKLQHPNVRLDIKI